MLGLWRRRVDKMWRPRARERERTGHILVFFNLLFFTSKLILSLSSWAQATAMRAPLHVSRSIPLQHVHGARASRSDKESVRPQLDKDKLILSAACCYNKLNVG